MKGRAGRFGLSKKGECYLFCKNQKELEIAYELVKGSSEGNLVKSQLQIEKSGLGQVVLDALASCNLSSEDELIDLLSKTLFAT